jgi:Kef-type K+ transport system membrane component KefB
MGFGLFHGDTTIPLLATLGIVSLFLFAGLEVDFAELRQGLAVTLGHLATQVFLLGLATWVFSLTFGVGLRAAILMSLAVLTPSAGFILDSLSSFGLTDSQRFWVKTKAIASELLALGALFAVSQSSSVGGLALSTLALVAMVLVLPLVFQGFAARVLPQAPKSEFAFLLILALICAYFTRQLGVYYLVGAFVVGVTAVRLRKRIPELASERLVAGIDLFASFFIPFYFFKAGLHFHAGLFQWRALLIGVSLVVVTIPVRVAAVAMYRKFALGEPAREAVPVALSLVPTLVFTVVLSGILRDGYGLSDDLFGALIVFALINTTIPGILLRPKKAAGVRDAAKRAAPPDTLPSVSGTAAAGAARSALASAPPSPAPSAAIEPTPVGETAAPDQAPAPPTVGT